MKLKLLVFLLSFHVAGSFAAADKTKFPAWLLGRFTKSRVQPEAKKNDQTCAICLNTRIDSQALICGHSFCSKCINTLQNPETTYITKCPTCHNIINQIMVKAGLPKDLINIIVDYAHEPHRRAQVLQPDRVPEVTIQMPRQNYAIHYERNRRHSEPCCEPCSPEEMFNCLCKCVCTFLCVGTFATVGAYVINGGF